MTEPVERALEQRLVGMPGLEPTASYHHRGLGTRRAEPVPPLPDGAHQLLVELRLLLDLPGKLTQEGQNLGVEV